MPVSLEHIKELYDYLFWGDRMMFSAATALPDAEYFMERGMSAGSIHKLLAHLMGAEAVWLERWRGQAPARIENADDHPTRAALDARWERVHADLREFLSKQTNESLAGPITFRSFTGDPSAIPLGELMVHVVDHASYHRGQLNTMIKQAGGQPAPVFYVTYQRQKHSQAAAV
jgi:uncharacterized damage-inducible protein DinB